MDIQLSAQQQAVVGCNEPRIVESLSGKWKDFLCGCAYGKTFTRE